MKDLNGRAISVMLSLSAFGIVIGSIVSFFKLPIFLDTIGIMLATLILGWRYGIASAVITCIIAFFFVSPYVPFYLGTMVGLVWFTNYANKKRMYNSFSKSLLVGLIHGIIGAFLSIPVTYILFEGFTATGNDAIVAFFVSQNFDLLWAVIISLGTFAIIDRIITVLFCASILKAIPRRLLISLSKNEG